MTESDFPAPQSGFVVTPARATAALRFPQASG